ncbi:ADP-ribosyl-[dinitrogen reductase] glycohydrolase [Novipirellula aureliae]|uniref:ADP-ribosyl-[dinitrogen reductase] glycohydrolase n=1 Tax=Novipirellula aureliae TaxID=2527966 RepID=A0A5C6DTB8_9BACT|nr:ADP-ribosylglycohydrolase family protein [Novipirellula aureliae]TWU40008.1 ADP-ribosyl-[dinitrogen reductase] glycohydrolase [Novipirellula aureliae]
MKNKAIVGCLLGTAVGDALGLPYEGVSPTRAPKLLGPPDRYRFFFRRGMISDDTEHTCMAAQSLIEAHGDVVLFARRFASRLRWWILALPAGVGKATARAGIKLWLGAKPASAGVFSAGNGPAMRAAIFGAAIDDLPYMLEFVRASSRLTHTDPKAEYGAIAVALAAKHSREHPSIDTNLWLEEVVTAVGKDASEFIGLLRQAIDSVTAGDSTKVFAQSLGLVRGVTGYTYHTVPVAIHAWLSHPRDFRRAVTTIIECGGDADTTAAIVGGIVGAGVGEDGIPSNWIQGIAEYPRSVPWMRNLGEALAVVDLVKDPSQQGSITRSTAKVATVNPIAVLLRNLLFLFIVLFHGFRRLAPPY